MPRTLYLGLKPPDNYEGVHCPLISIHPRPLSELKTSFEKYPSYTHLIFTSQTGVDLFVKAHQFFRLENLPKIIAAVGQSTGKALRKNGLQVDFIPPTETAEGLLPFFENLHSAHYLFWPHSALSRPVLTDYWQRRGIRYQECILYDTLTNYEQKLPSLDGIDEIVFTSPSTVDAFYERYRFFPENKKLTPIGPITAAYLSKMI